MSRTRAFKEPYGAAWREDLRKKGITLFGGALEEAPKHPRAVMASQADLAEAVGEFSPMIVRMDAGAKKNRRSRKAKRRSPADHWPDESIVTRIRPLARIDDTTKAIRTPAKGASDGYSKYLRNGL